MRRLALFGVLAGCNSIYGLEPTKVVDAFEPSPGSTKLSYLVGTTNGVTPGPVMNSAIQPAPVVRAAPLDGVFVDVPYGADGTVLYPNELIGTRWRLEYTVAGEPPHELQWAPGDEAGHAAAPLFGRVARSKASANTGFVVSMKVGLMQTTYMWLAPVVYTTGYWAMAPNPASTMPSIDLHTTTPLSGDFGAPQPGDVVFAVDYTSINACRVTSRAGSKMITGVQPGVMAEVALDEEPSSSAVTIGYADGGGTNTIASTQQRLADALGARTTKDNLARAIYARVMHAEMPAFTEDFDGVPAPLMLPLADCPAGTPPPPARDVGNLLAFPKRVFAFAANTRTYQPGVLLRSSIAGIAAANNNGEYVLTFPVHLAIAPKLGDIPLEADLAEPIGDTPRDLSFELEVLPPGGPALRTDYFEVVLYRIGNTLELVRVYVAAPPDLAAPEYKIRFDPRILVSGERYVFAIRTYRGRPAAFANDFTILDPIQAVGTIFTGTFTR